MDNEREKIEMLVEKVKSGEASIEEMTELLEKFREGVQTLNEVLKKALDEIELEETNEEEKK